MEKMTQKKLKSIIENAIEYWNIDAENTDREDIMKILREVEKADDTICFDLISDADGHPVSIQVFTDVKHNDKNYSIIQNFDFVLGGLFYKGKKKIQRWVESIQSEYKRAYDLRENFN